MTFGTLYRAEAREVTSRYGASMCLSQGKELRAYPMAAIGAEQHRLGEIEEPLQRPVPFQERRLHVGRCIFQRKAGRGPDRPVTVIGDDQRRSWAGGESLQMVRVITAVAVIEIWPFTEHDRAEP